MGTGKKKIFLVLIDRGYGTKKRRVGTFSKTPYPQVNQEKKNLN